MLGAVDLVLSSSSPLDYSIAHTKSLIDMFSVMTFSKLACLIVLVARRIISPTIVIVTKRVTILNNTLIFVA